ncbi:DUF3168 domain-containing protein [Brucella anthropi]|uniref:DUF3168 domain-containing protein n=1 Tax=Brucella anthropi TaxID=529 RepID=UPI00124C84A2|nr:DUF3168 domain-containing protein [Brucella anthropi]KAB2748044.1 DUF3168 domain-containing protein [Brucella anthropi]
MASLSNSLQVAVYNRLLAFTALTEIVGSGVYDMPPLEAAYPYVTLGEEDIFQDDVTCKKSHRVYFQVDGWSDHRGYKEVKDIAQAVQDALHEYPLEVASYRLISLTHIKTNFIRQPDGLLSHSVSDFLAYIEAL